MYALGMPNPLLWGAMAFTLNFIPYAGSAVTLVLLTIVALVSFDGVAKAVAVAGAYLFLTTFEGQVLQPVLVGRRLDVSPLFVVLGLWFGGWLWGISGVALAVPVMVGIKSIINAKERYPADAEVLPEATEETLAHRARSWATRSSSRVREAEVRREPEVREATGSADRSRGTP
jgi:predicted PurR-regulated permease PerM